MENKPEPEVVTASRLPKGCRCTWRSSHNNWGGDVKVGWILTTVEHSCPVHGQWLGSQDGQVDKSS